MSVKFTSVKCPECGANLPIEEGRTQLFCSYCGTKVIVTNENEHIYRHIDEAGIKQAETDRIVELKRMELAEKKRIASEKRKTTKMWLSVLLGLLAIITLGIGFTVDGAFGISIVGEVAAMILLFMWIGNKNEDDDDDGFDGKVKVPEGISDYEKKSYVAIEAIFRGAGFTNIKCIPLNDLTFGLLKKPNTVESITINGKNITSGGKRFAPDTAVVISYHSAAGKE